MQDNLVDVGVLFISLDNELIPYLFSLAQGCLNNTVDCEAIIIGLELARSVSKSQCQKYGDFKLIFKQLNRESKVRRADSPS